MTALQGFCQRFERYVSPGVCKVGIPSVKFLTSSGLVCTGVGWLRSSSSIPAPRTYARGVTRTPRRVPSLAPCSVLCERGFRPSLKSEVKKQSSKGKTFWRVIVGPAKSASDRTEMLRKIKAKGFADAYAVRG